MGPRNPLVEHMIRERMATALALLIIGLAGCALEPTPKASLAPANAAPYVGVFTGEYVDGKPLYRFPAIEIVGSRSSVGPSS